MAAGMLPGLYKALKCMVTKLHYYFSFLIILE